jgi:hypothetical protein
VTPVCVGDPHTLLWGVALLGSAVGFAGGLGYSWLARARFRFPRRRSR